MNIVVPAVFIGVGIGLSACQSQSPNLTPTERYALEGPDVLLCIERGRNTDEATAILARRAGSIDRVAIDRYCDKASKEAQKYAVPLRRGSDVDVYVDGERRSCYKVDTKIECN